MPVGPEEIARARRGDWSLVLTPTKPVPADWFPPLAGLDVLCLASGGGQQGPILAAAGANVTVFDNSPNQLAQDRLVADREGLAIETVQGDMADLSRLPRRPLRPDRPPRLQRLRARTCGRSGGRRSGCCVRAARSWPGS